MSFLNPVNEPVKRFKSTDAGAPQINYNARVAGDVKAVLKECLVTGYGATASAGWSIVNEVNHVAEFVSPSAAMSDYRLGIDDSTTTKTDWYYQYQNARVNPLYNTPIKTFTNVDKSHASNGWQLMVTGRGLVFVEIIYYTAISKQSVRITYFSQTKSGLNTSNTENIMFFNIGHNAEIESTRLFYDTRYPHFRLNGYNAAKIGSATPLPNGSPVYMMGVSNIDMVSSFYTFSESSDLLIGEISGFLSKIVNNTSDMFGVKEIDINGRPALELGAGLSTSIAANIYPYSRTYVVYLDYWGY